MSRRRKLLLIILALPVVGFILIQIIPVGRFIPVLERNPNPPVTQTIEWDSPETERLVRMACFDCHSNETVWPWYSQIAPVSWLTTRDVNRGRTGLNFSEMTADKFNLDHIEAHLYWNMPPRLYTIMHPEANLTDDQKAAILAGIAATFNLHSEEDMEGMDMGGN